MSDDTQVTYVGGKAIEQSEAAESNLEADEREAAKAAVAEAIKGAAKEAGDSAEKASKQDPYKPAGAKAEAPKKDPETGRFLPKGEKEAPKEEAEGEEEEELDLSKAGLKQLLKQREKVAKLKASAKDELSKEREKIAEETRKLQDTWSQMQAMQEDIKRQRAVLEGLKKDPAKAVREYGWEPEEFIVNLAKDGTPEGIAERQRREMQAELAEIRAWKTEMAQREQQARQWQQQQQMVNHRSQIEKQFLDLAFDAEKNPHIAEMYKGRENALIAEGDLMAHEFRQLSGGREANLSEIVEFIEETLAERFSLLYEKKSGLKKDIDPQVDGKKPAKGSKGKTLTPEMTSQRSTLNKKALKDLDEEERLAAAKESVGLAIAGAAER